MKELLVLSGKGGTGKTSIMASFAVLCDDAVLVDCDVDAANLYLVVHCERGRANEYIASRKALIDASKCSRCGRCAATCGFDAINQYAINQYAINQYAIDQYAVDQYAVEKVSCEGCGLCARVCPERAIEMVEGASGHWFHSNTPYGPLLHARLLAGEGNSGKLVSVLRENARKVADVTGKEMIILDGPPGIGCPVLASIAGVSLVLLVTEPTVSGLHDLGRVLKVCERFKVRTLVCVNRFDLDKGMSRRLEAMCYRKGIPVIGRVPVDHDVTRAMVHGMPVVEYSDGPAATAIRSLWRNIREAFTCDGKRKRRHSEAPSERPK